MAIYIVRSPLCRDRQMRRPTSDCTETLAFAHPQSVRHRSRSKTQWKSSADKHNSEET
jgi:hypothetical protein